MRHYRVLAVAVFAIKSLEAAPTPEEIRSAVARAVTWLTSVQDPANGSFGDELGTTGIALSALMRYATDPRYGLGLYSPLDPRNPQREAIIKGLNYILGRGTFVPIEVQPAGNPDRLVDGKGIDFSGTTPPSTAGNAWALAAICSAVEMDRLAPPSQLAGWPYWAVAQDVVDLLAWGQTDSGEQRGGWAPALNGLDGNNVESGWATTALAVAAAPRPIGCGSMLPEFVKSELGTYWIDYIQNDVVPGFYDFDDGGSGLSNPNDAVEVGKTGHLLEQMALAGDSLSATRVGDALGYLARWWSYSKTFDGYPGWGGTPWAMWAVMRGLMSFGLDRFGSPAINWIEDFETHLISRQSPDGSWPFRCHFFGCEPYAPIRATALALLTLLRAAPSGYLAVPVDIAPGACPNKLNLRSNGQVTVVIAGSSAFDVKLIDGGTLKLEGVSPLKWTYRDVTSPYEPYWGKPVDAYACVEARRDGVADLMMEFDLAALRASLESISSDGEVRMLRLKGYLRPEHGGTPIFGEDVVVISKK